MPSKASKRKEAAPQAQAPVKHAKRGGFYDTQYQKLLIIPIVMLLAAIAVIAIQTATTGDFIHRGVSLKGGVMVTIPSPSIDGEQLAQRLRLTFPGRDIESRTLEEAGNQIAVTMSADITPENEDQVELFLKAIEKGTGIGREDLSLETIGSSLGATFFQQTSKALFIAFLFMGMVVFLYFGEQRNVKIIAAITTVAASILMYNPLKATNIIAIILGAGLLAIYTRYSVPSVAVILAAFSDIVVTLAVVDLLGIKITTAGIAAFLMLIGYSVDTDILLSTRVLKRSTGTVYDRIINAVKTGLTMNFTTLAAVTVALLVAESPVITQIMSILLIGLIADMINTWFQNAGILRWYVERKEKKEARA